MLVLRCNTLLGLLRVSHIYAHAHTYIHICVSLTLIVASPRDRLIRHTAVASSPSPSAFHRSIHSCLRKCDSQRHSSTRMYTLRVVKFASTSSRRRGVPRGHCNQVWRQSREKASISYLSLVCEMRIDAEVRVAGFFVWVGADIDDTDCIFSCCICACTIPIHSVCRAVVALMNHSEPDSPLNCDAGTFVCA